MIMRLYKGLNSIRMDNWEDHGLGCKIVLLFNWVIIVWVGFVDKVEARFLFGFYNMVWVYILLVWRGSWVWIHIINYWFNFISRVGRIYLLDLIMRKIGCGMYWFIRMREGCGCDRFNLLLYCNFMLCVVLYFSI